LIPFCDQNLKSSNQNKGVFALVCCICALTRWRDKYKRLEKDIFLVTPGEHAMNTNMDYLNVGTDLAGKKILFFSSKNKRKIFSFLFLIKRKRFSLNA